MAHMEKMRQEVDDCREKVRLEVEKLAWAMQELGHQKAGASGDAGSGCRKGAKNFFDEYC